MNILVSGVNILVLGVNICALSGPEGPLISVQSDSATSAAFSSQF